MDDQVSSRPPPCHHHYSPPSLRPRLLLSCGLLLTIQVAQAFLIPAPNTAGSSSHPYVNSLAPTTPNHGYQPMTIMAARGNNRGGGSVDKEGPSKRQLRVGSLLQSEIADIIRKGYEVKSEDVLDDSLRSRISVVDVECSPDIRFAKVAVSIYGETVDKREAFVWLVDNAKAIRHALSQRLKDMRQVPEISFRQDDLSAGADMFHLLSQLEEDRKMRTSFRRSDDLEVEWSDDDDDGFLDEEESDDEDDDFYDDDEDEEEEAVEIVPYASKNKGGKKPQVRRQLQRMQREDDDDMWDSDDDFEGDFYGDADDDDEEDEEHAYALQRALGRRPGNSNSNRKQASAVLAKALGAGRRGYKEEEEDVLSPFEASLKVGSLEQELAMEINAMKAAGITEFDWSDDEDEDDEDDDDVDDFLPPKKIPPPKKTRAKTTTTTSTKTPKAAAAKKTPPSKGTSIKQTKVKPGKVTRKTYREEKYG